MNREEWIGPLPSGNNSHFESGEKFRIGASLYGARSFLAHPSGWLSGITYKKIWRPGVNVAGCYKVTGFSVPGVGVVPDRPSPEHMQVFNGKQRSDGSPDYDFKRVGWRWKLDGETGISQSEGTPVYGNDGDLDHDLVPCGCGFHGYYRGSLDFAYDKKSVNGIVRAFGKVRVARKGFRASHAEIVALYVPPEPPERGRFRPSDFQSVAEGMRWAGMGSEVNSDLVEAISGNYPNVPLYFDLDEMLHFHETEEPM